MSRKRTGNDDNSNSEPKTENAHGKKTKEKKEPTYNGIKSIKPRTINQNKYVLSLESNQITFGVGPAGTGKTILAVDYAVKEIIAGKFKKLIITRPTVEAGEKLGFLPGTFEEKIDPFLRPIYDYLKDILVNGNGNDRGYSQWVSTYVEIAPLAYMRGRTFNDSILILDEAQNTTEEQILLFLTRLGETSKAIITADPDQIDLPRKVRSGIVEAVNALYGTEDIGCIIFDEKDVIRSRIVKHVIESYKRYRLNPNEREVILKDDRQ